MKNDSGLEGFVVAQTELSLVDGAEGRLLLRGRPVQEACRELSFEDTAALLWSRPRSPDLGPARVRAFERLSRRLDELPRHPMDALRALIASLPEDEATPEDVTAAMAVAAAGIGRRQLGLAPIAPRATSRHASDYLRMLMGEEPDPERARAVEAYLVAVSDHGMNASTFTARVIASTGSDLASSITGAIGALKGPLHGGAPGPVLDMLDAIGSAEHAAEWIEEELNAGRRIMGMGHRVYRTRDPRAAALEGEVERLEVHAQRGRARLELARTVERVAEAALARRHPDRPLRANVEFYTAVLLEAAGLPRSMFTPTFAVARVLGWCGHVLEQQRTGRLIRPRAEYIGPRP